MTAIVRHTDVLGGIVGGFPPLVPFAGWRTYTVAATYDDAEGIEFTAFKLVKSGGPLTDTIAQNNARTGDLYVDRTWPYGNPFIKGSFPALAWYLLDPSTLAIVAGPLLPLGNAANQTMDQGTREITPTTDHYVQWFDFTTPTGPYIAFQVSRDPSERFPLFISGHPVEISERLLTEQGEAYDAASASDTLDALGPDLRHIMTVMDPDGTPQDTLDRLSEAYGFAIRRHQTTGDAEFVVWLEKLAGLPSAVIDLNSVRAEGGPTFDLSDATRITRVRVSGEVVQPWNGEKSVTRIDRVGRKLFGEFGGKGTWTREVKRIVPSTEVPAHRLMVHTAEIIFDYSTDGVTPDSDIYGVQEAVIDLAGMPGLRLASGGAQPLNLEQFAEGRARLLFDAQSRGRQMATVPLKRGVAGDTAGLIGDAVTLDLDHLPNAQLGQTPTSQRGGQRPVRVVKREDQPPGPVLSLADEGTGVPLALTPYLVVKADGGPNGEQLMRVEVSDASDLADAGAQVEFQMRAFAPGETRAFNDPGFRYTIDDATTWTDEPQVLRLGDYPQGYDIYLRARAFLFGGAAGAWSGWTGLGGVVTGPQATLSDLIIDQITDEGARLTWSYDESPQVGDVRVEVRDVTGGVIGPWVGVTGSPFAPGTETTTLTGYASGSAYEVRVILIDGFSVEYGDQLLGSFVTTGGRISTLIVSSVVADGAKLNWTNTNSQYSVRVEYRVTGDPFFQLYQDLAAGSNRLRLTGLQPSTGYDVQVSLLAGFTIGDGAGGPSLTDSFTTTAISLTLEPPLLGGVFEAWDPVSGTRADGRFGVRLYANTANNATFHHIIPLLAVETAVGSGTPGTFVEQSPLLGTPGVELFFIADAPNDGKLRYMKALSRSVGYNDSAETAEVSADPWSNAVQPPAGGGITATTTITTTATAGGGSVTGSLAIPDGATIFQVDSVNSKDIRLRLYTDSTVLASDAARASNDSNWPVGLLFDAEILAADGYSIAIPPSQRIQVILALHEDQLVWYRLTNLEVGAEDLQCRISYIAAPTGGSGTLV